MLSQHIHDAICKFLYSLIKVFMVKIVKIYTDTICNIQCDQWPFMVMNIIFCSTCLIQMTCICHFVFFFLPRASYMYIQCGFIPSTVWRFSNICSSYFKCRKLALNRKTSYMLGVGIGCVPLQGVSEGLSLPLGLLVT